MVAWRMAFRVGKNGEELWPQCRRLCLAVIEYDALLDVDLSQHEEGEPRSAWSELSPPQQSALKRFVYKMDVGHVIYVKQGRKIVGRGVVGSPYRFHKRGRIKAADGTPWQHQRRVVWDRDFPEISILMGKQQAIAVVPLSDDDVKLVEEATATEVAEASGGRSSKHAGGVGRGGRGKSAPARQLVDVYVRATSAQLQKIKVWHNGLSRFFCEWLNEKVAKPPRPEVECVDVWAEVAGQSCLFELKTTRSLAGARFALREALGQVLEYAYYPGREPPDCLAIVLDATPSDDDVKWFEGLAQVGVEVELFWQDGKGFKAAGITTHPLVASAR